MNAGNIPDSNYIHIERWMYKLDLNLSEIAILACIHGFCQDGESFFKGSVEYLQVWSNSGRSTVFSALKKLVERKLIVKLILSVNGKLYPVYYTVRSRRLYQENAERNRKVKTGSVSPKNGLESGNQTEIVQKSDESSPESGPNNIALHDLKNAAGEEADSLLAARLNFISQKLQKSLGCDPYSKKFRQKLNLLLESKGFDDEMAGEFIQFVADKTRAKNPESIPALFRSLVFAEDVVADFIMKTYESKKDENQESNSYVECPCCGEKNKAKAFNCKKCDFTFADRADSLKVLQAKQIYELPPEKKSQFESEVKEVISSFDFRKLMNPTERIRQKEMFDCVYKKYGIVVGK